MKKVLNIKLRNERKNYDCIEKLNTFNYAEDIINDIVEISIKNSESKNKQKFDN